MIQGLLLLFTTGGSELLPSFLHLVWGVTLGVGIYSLLERLNDHYRIAGYFCLGIGAVVLTGLATAVLTNTDPSVIVLDEATATVFLLVSIRSFFRAHQHFLYIPAVLIFSVFDATKPFGTAQLESLPGGIGIVADDLYAAMLAFGILIFLQRQLVKRLM